ncbi:hypothetical protein GCM10009554_07920 [Kribbella koreensis]|uniref:Uncharacterized protein n=1 Tax=Kribbella koreensis TaxID=57909 RepID=A0ABN1PFA5_9ACTN
MQTESKTKQMSSGYLVFLGWVGVELAGYALLALLASDEPPATCSGLCFTDRGLILLLGMMFGVLTLGVQLVVGVPLTRMYGRRGMRPRGAGSAAFFTTFGVIALVLGVLSVANLSHM